MSLWLRRHPVVGDSVMALVLALLTISESNEQYARHHPMAYWTVGVLMVVPVVFRRRWPIPTAYLIALVGTREAEAKLGIHGHDSVSRLVALSQTKAIDFDLPRLVQNVGGLLIGAVETTSHCRLEVEEIGDIRKGCKLRHRRGGH